MSSPSVAAPEAVREITIAQAVNEALAEELLDLLGQRSVLAEIDGFATEALGLRQPLRNHVADDHHRRAQQVARRRAG